MAIIQSICDSFRAELAEGQHDFTNGTGHNFSIALYTSLANLSNVTTVYDPTGEVQGAGYTAGGFDWTAANNITPQSVGSITYWSFNVNPSWPAATINARGALIYNKSNGNKAVCVLDFGADKSSFNGLFTLVLPPNGPSSSIIRLE